MTTKRNLFILLVSWNLIQVSLANSTVIDSNEEYLKSHDLCQLKQNYADMADVEKDSNIAPSIELLKITLYYLQDSALTYARKAKDICELLIKDPALDENFSKEMQNFKRNIEKYLEVYITCRGMEELLKLIDFYAMFTLEYYKMEKKAVLTANEKIILDVLKKYDSQKLNGEYENNFNIFVSNFAKKFDEIEKDLKEEKGELAVKITQWWKKAKEVKDYEEKFQEFIRFMKLHKDNNRLCGILNTLSL